MRKYILLYLAIFIILAAGCKKNKDSANSENDSSAKGSIFGVVTDFATGEPVKNANVQLRPTGETTLTGYDGMYEFLGIADGDYSITVSKAEYDDLMDDYVISVRDGKRMKRDVQIEKTPTYIRITNLQGENIDILDFGADVSTRVFNVFNCGTVNIRCQTVYSCSWISSVSELPASIAPGQVVPVTVNINRSLLSPGQNSTVLAVSSNNGSNELTITATSSTGNPPSVELSSVSNITPTSATCFGRVTNTNSSTITACGFCYSTHTNPTINDEHIQLNPSTETFSYNLIGLEHNVTYHVRAFASSNLGTGYSSEITFTTVSCEAECGITSITNIDAGSVHSESEIRIEEGCSIKEAGICWSTNHTPTNNDETICQVLPNGITEWTTGGMLYPLEPGRKYHVRSYAKNQFGEISYGPEKTFTTLTGLPTVTTSQASLSSSEIITGGNAIGNANTQGTVILSKGICYGTNPNPDLSNNYDYTIDGYGEGSFTSYIPIPSFLSGYLYIRAYATTHFGTAYGNQVQVYIP